MPFLYRFEWVHMQNYLLSIIGFIIGCAILVTTQIYNLDLFEYVIAALASHEHFEFDELIIPVTIFFAFAFFDAGRRERLKKIEVQKAKIYKAMLFSTHHILNNFLNQVQYFKLIAERTPGFDPKILKMYDQSMESAKTQIELLSNVTHLDEETIRDSVTPKAKEDEHATRS